MKTIREKMAQKEQLTWSEWSTLAAVKIFALSLAFGAISGIGILAFKPLLEAANEGNYVLLLAYILTILSVIEGAPILAKKVHDRLLSWFEVLHQHAS
jgi:uncharacterized membrane protein YhaH (DUF805 family)